MLIAPRTWAKRPSYDRPARPEHRPDHLEVIAEGGHPLAEGREAVAVRPPLLFLPAGADPELEAAAADDVDRRRQLGGQGRVAEPGAHDHVAEADAFGRHRQRGQDGERLEGDLVGRVRARCGSDRRPRAIRSRASRRSGPARPCGPRPRPGPSRRTRPSSPAAPSGQPACRTSLKRSMVTRPAGSVPRRRRRATRAVAGCRRGCRPILALLRRSHRCRPNPAFDPTAALPGPPDPWAYTGQPSLRPGPPYHMTEMIEAEPALAGRLLRRGPGVERSGGAGRRDPRRWSPPASRSW